MKLYFLALSLFLVSHILAQNTFTDSLKAAINASITDSSRVDLYCDLSNALSRNNTKMAILYADSALQLAKESGYKTGIADAYTHIGAGQIYLGMLDSAEVNNKKALNIYTELDSKTGELNALNNLSVVQLYRGDMAMAIDIAKKALKIAQDIGKKKKVGKLYNNIGLMQYHYGAYDSSVVYTFKALEIFKTLNDKQNIKGACINLGNSFLALNDSINTAKYLYEAVNLARQTHDNRTLSIAYSGLANMYLFNNRLDTALTLLLKALEIDRHNNDIQGVAINTKALAKLYMKQGRYELALEKLNEGTELQKQIGNKFGLIVSYYDMAEIYYLQQKYKQAETYALKSLKLAQEFNSMDNERMALEQLSNIYPKLNDYPKAFNFLKKSNILKDSIFNIDKQKEVDALNIQFQTAEKEKENQRLSFENQSKESQLKSERTQKYIFAILFLLIIITLYFIIKTSKQKRKQLLLEIENKSITENLKGQEQERLIIAEELHDDIGGTLASTILIIDGLLKKNPDLSILSKVSKAINDSYNYIRLTSHQLAHFSKMNKTLLEGIDEFINSIQHTKTATITYINKLNIKLDSIDENTKTNIYRSVQELIINAIKHSEANNITLIISNGENKLKIVVLDDGKGFSKHTKNGIGLSNIESRLKTMNATMNINTDESEGSTIIVEIPLSSI